MMNYEEFKEHVADHIREYLPEDYGTSVVELMDVVKNNDEVRSGLRITKEDSNVSPTIYLGEFFEQYKDGADMDSILSGIAEIRLGSSALENFNVHQLTNLDQVKDKIQCKLIGLEANTKYLQDKPHMIKEDLAIVYNIEIESTARGKMATVITNGLMKELGLNKEELHSIAMSNLMQSEPEFKSMRDILIANMFPDGLDPDDPMANFLPPKEETPSMYVLTNKDSINGATQILNDKLMSEIAEKVGGDFIILPSSIHEVIILPWAVGMERAELEAMIQDVNATQVSPEERLSDKPYSYDSKAHELMRMDKMEQMRDKIKSRERVSLKDKLAEKKQEVMGTEKARAQDSPKLKRAATALE